MDIDVIQQWAYIPMQALLIVAIVTLWREQMRMRKKMESMLDRLFKDALQDTGQSPLNPASKKTS